MIKKNFIMNLVIIDFSSKCQLLHFVIHFLYYYINNDTIDLNLNFVIELNF